MLVEARISHRIRSERHQLSGYTVTRRQTGTASLLLISFVASYGQEYNSAKYNVSYCLYSYEIGLQNLSVAMEMRHVVKAPTRSAPFGFVQ